jgi:septum site-determining protein MinD
MASVEITKHWDEARGRMVLLAKNGPGVTGAATVEDVCPDGLSGVLCFAKQGGALPRATADGGKIRWQLAGMRPGEVRELIYTALPLATLKDPCAPKRPSDRDRALLESTAGIPPVLILEDAGPGAASELTGTDALTKAAEPATRPIIPGVAIPVPSAQAGGPGPEPVAAPEPGARDAEHVTSPGKAGGLVVSIGAGKGGTGKTTFAINLALALACLGFRTVLLDADASMGNLGPYLGIDVQGMRATLHDVLAGEAEPEKAACQAFHENLRVVPSGLSIGGFLKMDRNLLAEAIGHYARGADFVVIDTPAGYNKEVALSLKASDCLVLVLNPDEGSMIDGLKVQEMAGILGVKVTGIVMNRYDMRGGQYDKAGVEAHFGTQVIAMLPEDPNVRRKDHVPAVLASPGSRAAQEIKKVAALLSGRSEPPGPDAKPFATRLIEALFRP